MSSAQVGGDAPRTYIYGKNNTGGSVSPGAVLQYDVAAGVGDGYDFVNPDFDATQPETYHAKHGVVSVADGPMASGLVLVDQAHLALICEGLAPLVSVDGSGTSIVAGDLLIPVDGSTALVRATQMGVRDGLETTNSTASAEAGGTSTAQVFHDQTATIAANTLMVGDRIEIFGQGYIADNNSTDTAIISVQFGGTDIGLSAAVDVNDSDVWAFHGSVYVTAIGASGTMLVAGTGGGPDALGVAAAWPLNASLTSIDTTAAVVLRTGVQFSVSHAENGSIQRLLGYRVIRQSVKPLAVARAAATTATNIECYIIQQ